MNRIEERLNRIETQMNNQNQQNTQRINKITSRTTDISVDEIYTVALSDASKVVLATYKK